MTMDRERADQLFMAVAGRAADGRATDGRATAEWDRREVGEWSLDQVRDELERLVDCPEERDTCLFSYIRAQARAERLDRLRALVSDLERRALDGHDFSVPLSHLRVVGAYFRYRMGRSREALDSLEREIPKIQRQPRSCYSDYVHVQALVHLGACYESSGNLFQTELCYRQALRISTRRGFFKRYQVRSCLGKVLWASGQLDEALEIHVCREARSAARIRGEFRFLVDSHLNAAKCAIDLKDATRARRELEAAEGWIARHTELSGVPRGYWLLFKGELDTLEGNVDEALTGLTRAVDHFEALDPPCYPGSIQAKTSLCHFAIFEGDFRLASAIIRKLLDEADHKDCPDARGRLLLLESYLFLTDEPPGRSSFDSLTRRLHLISNPALLFHALGNLYTYSLEFLDEPEQAFLLARIRNLKPLLKRSCYRDLYQNYVTKRYEYAIENRLARYLQNGFEGQWDKIEAVE